MFNQDETASLVVCQFVLCECESGVRECRCCSACSFYESCRPASAAIAAAAPAAIAAAAPAVAAAAVQQLL